MTVKNLVSVGVLSLLFLTAISLFIYKKPAFAQYYFTKSLRTVIHNPYKAVCGTIVKNNMRCFSHIATTSSGTPLTNSSPYSSSYGPLQFHTGYNLPCTPGGTVNAFCQNPTSFGPQTIGIIDAYNDETLQNDLNTYDNYYKIPQCTTANGCLRLVNQNGGTSLPTSTNTGWALETSLDVEVAHMICQTCQILVVEANSSSFSNLGTSVNTAASLGATEISNSYGSSEWSSETAYDSYYSHPGIAVTVSAGDSGYGAQYPAASTDVIAVGGTTLQLFSDNSYSNESVWSDTGSGCSSYEPAQNWQLNLPNWNQTKCQSHRAIADVSADADPNTGAAVYDSTPYDGSSGWFQVGGTSLSSPIIAGSYALAGNIAANTIASSIPYLYFTSTDSHNITSGSNGSCGTIMCKGQVGYNGPGGLGSPNGINGFGLNIPNETPTLTPLPTLTPTLTLTPTPSVGTPTPSPTAIPTNTPTPTLAPTITPAPTASPTTYTFGYTSVGPFSDINDANHLDGTRFISGSTGGTLKSISVYVSQIQSAPNNEYQLALFSDNNGTPGTLLAFSANGTLTSNSWNTQSLSYSVKANTYYWLVYNTNATNEALNNLRFTVTSTKNGMDSSSNVSFGSFPTSFSSNKDPYEYSMYATYTTP